MSFSISSLVAGFFYGVWGVFLIKRGKSDAHVPSILIGVALVAYPYFVENAYILWLTGAALLSLAYLLRRS